MKANNSVKITTEIDLVTMRIHGQLLGIPAQNVCEVLKKQQLTHVPLVPSSVAGVFNLRGRIVTVLDICHRLGLPPNIGSGPGIFVIMEYKNNLYSLIVDSIGDVLSISQNSIQTTPPNLESTWQDVALGVHSLKDELLVILEHQNLFVFEEAAA